MPLPFSSSRFLYENSQGVVFIALSWLVLVTMWSSCCVCVNQHLVAHTSLQPPVTKRREKRNWWSEIKKPGERAREREREREMIFSCSSFSLITWLFSDLITTAVPRDTFHSHTFHIPEMYWQTHMCRHQSAVSPTAAAPPTLTNQAKKVRKVERNSRVGTIGDQRFQQAFFKKIILKNENKLLWTLMEG